MDRQCLRSKTLEWLLSGQEVDRVDSRLRTGQYVERAIPWGQSSLQGAGGTGAGLLFIRVPSAAVGRWAGDTGLLCTEQRLALGNARLGRRQAQINSTDHLAWVASRPGSPLLQYIQHIGHTLQRLWPERTQSRPSQHAHLPAQTHTNGLLGHISHVPSTNTSLPSTAGLGMQKTQPDTGHRGDHSSHMTPRRKTLAKRCNPCL